MTEQELLERIKDLTYGLSPFGSLLIVNECLSPFRDLKWILFGFVVFPLLFLQTFAKVSPAFLTASWIRLTSKGFTFLAYSSLQISQISGRISLDFHCSSLYLPFLKYSTARLYALRYNVKKSSYAFSF